MILNPKCVNMLQILHTDKKCAANTWLATNVKLVAVLNATVKAAVISQGLVDSFEEDGIYLLIGCLLQVSMRTPSSMLRVVAW